MIKMFHQSALYRIQKETKYMIIGVKFNETSSSGEHEISEVFAKAGDYVRIDEQLIVIESDKAAIDITSHIEGEVISINVSVGQKVKEGQILMLIDTSKSRPIEKESPPVTVNAETNELNVELVVLGSGPGGYTAAFRAADLGVNTVIVERYPTLGGVCLNVGCIPSKSLLHLAKIINEAKEVSEFGVSFCEPKIDIDKIRSWKESVLNGLTLGIKNLANKRTVSVLHGEGQFINSHQLQVVNNGQKKIINFDKAIVAAGSHSTEIAGLPNDPRIINSTDALELESIPKRLLIIGGGIIGLEMANIYDALGSEVTIVAKYNQLIPECDEDIVRPLSERIKSKYKNIYYETSVTKIEPSETELTVYFSGKITPIKEGFDKVLVCIGRRPNGRGIGAEHAGIYIDDFSFIPVNKYQQTNVQHIYAIGDIAGKPMLAHKALHEAVVAAESVAGLHTRFDAKAIPSVAYTDPEVATVGVTEKQAIDSGIRYGIGIFPWAASGRSLSLGRNEGKTKLIFDLATNQVIGGGIVGPGAGDLIAEVALAIENNNTASEISSTIHPHPTLSETIAFAAEVYEGTITDLYLGSKPDKTTFVENLSPGKVYFHTSDAVIELT
jgi:dihydrolipoamide dehydrogenase